MQPVLLITSTVPGLLWVNGRPAGELDGDNPVTRPVSPQGPVYLQHFPTKAGYLPLTWRLTFSAGKLLPVSLDGAQGLCAVAWPGGAVEVEMTPQALAAAEAAPFSPLALPGAVQQEDGSVRALEPLNDTVGHVRLNTYRLEGGAWQIIHTETLWSQGGPRWPVTPEETAMAMAEACLLGLHDEARGYLLPGTPLPSLEGATGCVSMRYPLPGGRSAVGLIYLAADSLAVVQPMYYRAVATGGPQGTWRLDDILVESGGAY